MVRALHSSQEEAKSAALENVLQIRLVCFIPFPLHLSLNFILASALPQGYYGAHGR